MYILCKKGNQVAGFATYKHKWDNKFGYHVHHAGNCSYKQRTTGSKTKTYNLLAKIKMSYHFQGKWRIKMVLNMIIVLSHMGLSLHISAQTQQI